MRKRTIATRRLPCIVAVAVVWLTFVVEVEAIQEQAAKPMVVPRRELAAHRWLASPPIGGWLGLLEGFETGVWTQIGDTGGMAVHALALDPVSPSRIYAGTYFEGLFLTPNSGGTWSNPLTASVGAIAVDPDNPATVYAGTWHNGAQKSTSSGSSWTPINTGLQANDVYALALDPDAANALYAGTEMGIFTSSSGGGSWQGASSGFAGRNVYALAFTGSTLLAGTDMGAFRSANHALSWVPANSGLSANQVFALAADGGTAYAGTDQGVFRSDDDGATWSAATSGLPAAAVHALQVLPGEPETVFAGTGQGVYASGDGGGNWVGMNDGLTGWALQVGALALDASTSPATLYAGTGSGVWKRTVAVEEIHKIYLPVVLRDHTPPAEEAGIYGWVTYQGAAAPGIQLDLRRYDGASWSTATTTTTGGDGRYLFAGVPSLGADQIYYVLYGPNQTDDRYLFVCYGPDLTAYTAGTLVGGGDFDIANVVMVSPGNGANVALPAAFTWQRRGLSGDSYRWALFEPAGDRSWWTIDLGDVGSFTLSGLPEGAVHGQEYGWEVWVCRGPDSCGSSFYYRTVTFSAGQSPTAWAPAAVDLVAREREVLKREGEGE